MIKARTINGPKDHIAREIDGIAEEIVEVIVFVDESTGNVTQNPKEDIFAEMEPFTVQAGEVDYSRESIYAPPEAQ